MTDEQMLERIATDVRSFVARQLAPIQASIEKLTASLAESAAVASELADVKSAIETLQRLPGPPGKDGRDGIDGKECAR